MIIHTSRLRLLENLYSAVPERPPVEPVRIRAGKALFVWPIHLPRLPLDILEQFPNSYIIVRRGILIVVP